MKSNGQLQKEVNLTDVRETIINKGFTEENLMKCIQVYSNDDVWMRCGADGSKLRWLSIEDTDDEL
jgi:DNA replication licensing factor MCM7